MINIDEYSWNEQSTKIGDRGMQMPRLSLQREKSFSTGSIT
jgi:hypothetical protein